MRHNPEVQQCLASYQLGLPRIPIAGRTGELLGRGAGSSVEFQEYREYLPGDDIRHVDWAAFARSDTLMVRLYREEISPRTEILIDASLSMKTGTGAKEYVARQLVSLFAQLCGRIGGRPTIIPLNDDRPASAMGLEMLDVLETLPFAGRGTLLDALADGAVTLKPQAVRIVISDFLFPHDPDALLKRMAAGASTIWVIQLLNRFEADPEELGGRRLIDVEVGVETDLLINKKAIQGYRERLGRLQEGLVRACRRVHAPFATLIADRGLSHLCRKDLCEAEMLRIG